MKKEHFRLCYLDVNLLRSVKIVLVRYKGKFIIKAKKLKTKSAITYQIGPQNWQITSSMLICNVQYFPQLLLMPLSAQYFAFKFARTKDRAKSWEVFGGMQPRHTAKVVLVGDSGVGKSTILSSYRGERFNPCYVQTRGAVPRLDFAFTANAQWWWGKNLPFFRRERNKDC